MSQSIKSMVTITIWLLTFIRISSCPAKQRNAYIWNTLRVKSNLLFFFLAKNPFQFTVIQIFLSLSGLLFLVMLSFSCFIWEFFRICVPLLIILCSLTIIMLSKPYLITMGSRSNRFQSQDGAKLTQTREIVMLHTFPTAKQFLVRLPSNAKMCFTFYCMFFKF